MERQEEKPDFVDRNADTLNKLQTLFKGGMADYSKIVKLLQYICVITSEYNLTRFHLRGYGIKSRENNLIGGPKELTDDQTKELKVRWKKLGSAFSTVRMTTRFGEFLDQARFFLERINSLLQGKTTLRDESKLKWVMNFMDFWGGVTDNWVYLERIDLIKYSSEWQGDWVDYLSSWFTVVFILLSMYDKLRNIYRDALKKLKEAMKSSDPNIKRV